MKSNIKFALILSFFALFIYSCQNEAVDETGQNQEETLVPNSPLANLMRSTASNDGAVDDILDNASCFSVELPVTIIANGITVTIESVEDLAVLEDLFSEFDDDEDDLEFLFPITIILNDYEEIIIENQEQLEEFVEDCIDDQEEVIECVDFVYPISFSIYNTDFQVIDNVVINNDEELHDFIENLNADNDEVTLASLDFPVSLIYGDGSTVEVSNNEELESAINAAEELCDAADDVCEVEDVELYMQECYWIVETYNGDDHLQVYAFDFSEDGTLNVINNDTAQYITGEWNMSVSNDGYPEIVISGLDDLQDMNGSWIVYECDEDELLLKQEIDGQLVVVEFIQECGNELNCTAQEIALTLKECKWWMNTDLLSPNYSGPLFFNEDGTVNIGYDNGNQLTGTWDVVIGNTGIFLVLDVPGDYEPISLDWRIVECDDDRLGLTHDDSELVLEQECSEEPDCSQDDVANYLTSCNIVPTINGYTSPLTTFQFNEDNTLSTMYQGDLPHNGTWDISSDDQGVFIIITFNGLEEYNGQWYLIECADNEMIFHQGDDELILTCEQDWFSCFENTTVTVCDDDGTLDYFVEMDLNMFYPNCTANDDIEVSYFYTLADAHAEVNPFPNVFVNDSNPQTIYARVEVAGSSNIYEVFQIEVIVVDCSDSDTCSETDVDNILQECYWIPISVAGDDNFNDFTFEFNDNQNLTVEGGGISGVGVWMTYGNGENDPTTVEVSQLEGNLQMFNGTWTVVECSETQMIFTLPNGSEMILDRECE